MPKYYFDVRNGAGVTRDLDGLELRNLDEATEVAREYGVDPLDQSGRIDHNLEDADLMAEVAGEIDADI
jgi:hypothetical protein